MDVYFKFRVYRVLFGLSHDNVHDFSDHHGCRLGKWYSEGEGRQHSHLNGYKEMDEPHQVFHREAKAAVEAHRRGNSDATITAVKAYGSSGHSWVGCA